MRIFHVFMMTVALLLACPASAQLNRATHIAAGLTAESARPASGGTTTIAFRMAPQPGWHGYWENPGDAGGQGPFDAHTKAGVAIGPLRYPVPDTLLVSGLMNHVYKGSYAVLATLSVASDVAPGTPLPIRAKASWLACTDKVCVPEQGEMVLDLVAGDGTVAPPSRDRFDAWRMRLPRPLGSPASYAISDGRLRVAIPFPASVMVDEAHLFPLTEGFSRYAAPQTVRRAGDMLIVEADAASERMGGAMQAVLRTGDHQGFLLTASPGPVPAETGSGPTLLLALGGALLGGLILNIMPCVFPILGLKAMSLARAGGDERSARQEAIAYTGGVIVTCIALGGLLLGLRAAGAALGWAFQLQDPRIILLLLLLVTAIALNLAGLFALPTLGGGDRLARRSGASGAFWTGALVAFVATPCTGPFMGAAMGAALVLPPLAALAVFAGLGLGLALPFLAIGFVPALRRRLPRPGPWMERVQRLLSIPMFLTALGLLWLLGRQRGTEALALGLIAALLLAGLLWWLGRRQRGGRQSGGGAILVAGLLLLAGSAALLPIRPSIAQRSGDAIPFDQARLASLRAQGRPVFLYFTADWCLTCKANEAAAIDRAETRAAFQRAGVTTMVGDWTNADPAITRFLESRGRSGVPLYLWFAPGRDEQILPQLLTAGTLTGLVD